MDESALRYEVIQLLHGAQAHVTLEAALEGLSPAWRTHRQPGFHSVWQILEHMRIAQKDILRYTLEPNWVSPAWPEAYWPENPLVLSNEAWEETRAGLEQGLERAVQLAQDVELTATIPHTEGHTYLRQLLLIADHNAYHLGQIVAVRRLLGQWE